MFTQQVGMTPRQYGAACRLRRFGTAVHQSTTITAALHEAGYSSSSRLYEAGALGYRLGLARKKALLARERKR